MLHVPGLFVAETKDMGRGVFTAFELNKGDTIEVCPLIIIPPEHFQKIHESNLHDYYFIWPEPKGSACIALGYGSLYNHRSNSNANIFFNIEEEEIVVEASVDIPAGSEIFIDYNGGLEEDSNLWFKPVKE